MQTRACVCACASSPSSRSGPTDEIDAADAPTCACLRASSADMVSSASDAEASSHSDASSGSRPPPRAPPPPSCSDTVYARPARIQSPSDADVRSRPKKKAKQSTLPPSASPKITVVEIPESDSDDERPEAKRGPSSTSRHHIHPPIALTVKGTAMISRSYCQEHDEIGESIIDVQQELTTTTQQQKALAAQLKELKSQKKELDRVPRHSTSGRTAQSTSSIPQLVGNADSDSDVDSAAPQTSSSPPVSSPAPLLRPLDCNDTDFLIAIRTTAPSESVAFDPEFNAPLDSLPALCPEPPREFNQESAVPAPVFPQPHLNILAEDLFSFPPVFPQPLLDIPEEDFFSFLDTPGFDSDLFFNTPTFDFDAQIAALRIDFHTFDDQPLFPPTSFSSQRDWPVLPCAPLQSPAYFICILP
ncbi:hypothetical protein B0H17DRAFT_1201634 [Mycena rosella]|uniref:Uncharacterized protein n=1 Tax=Mycena rosella TaxID=1033263 RepID=A0AAD7GH14_MYCRO|nr:hypothetical protein B0H17DRAFT_1201634 [Mycena rosella]